MADNAHSPTAMDRVHTDLRSGFSLIEMAIVLVIVGIIIAIVASVLPSLIASSKIKQARATLEKFDYAMQGYLSANGHMPCPDTDGDGIENRTAGTTPPTDDLCDAYAGQIPYITLGLSAALDPWQEPVRYAVYEDLVRTQLNGLCDAAPPCTLCLSYFMTTPNAAFLRTTLDLPSGAVSTNQAYVLASGGASDLDGAGGFFDNRNGDATIEEFEAPNKIVDAAYDDLVTAASFAYLRGKLCSGGLGAGGSSGTVEGPSAGNCADGLDNDADGATDCADSGCATDPACTGGSSVTISTATIPGGTLAGTYMVSFSAAGGTAPYTWALSGNGGFSDFSLSAFGTLTGTLNQCPGDYTISVGVEDSTAGGSGGPYTDSHTYTLQVSGDLNIACTSTPGTAITWASSTQTETFAANGSRLGTIDWSLNTGGAAGFSLYPNGDNTSVLRKTGSTAPGTYTFTLSATDNTCSTNTASLLLDVTVTAGGGGYPGAISGVTDAEIFSEYECYTPAMIHTSGNYYGFVFRGSSYFYTNDGWTRTLDIDATGAIGTQATYSQFDGTAWTPDVTHVSGNVYVIAYEGSGNSGRLRTVSMDSTGAITNGPGASSFSNNCADPDIVPVSGEIFAIAYTGPGMDGYITTARITAGGAIIDANVRTLEFDNISGLSPDIIHVAGETYAVAYQGNAGLGMVKTVLIDSAGAIRLPSGTPAAGNVFALAFDAATGAVPHIVHVSGDVFAIVYQGADDTGYVKTLRIASDGQISDTVIDTLIFEADTCITPVMVAAGSGIFAIAYRGPGNDGIFTTVLIDDSGQIGDAIQDSIVFETDACYEPDLVAMGNDVFAVAYRRPASGNRGVVATISLQ